MQNRYTSGIMRGSKTWVGENRWMKSDHWMPRTAEKRIGTKGDEGELNFMKI